MPMESFKCGYCSCPATKLLFYEKQYPNGKTTVESPMLSCDLCTEKTIADLSIVRGGIEGVYIKTFKELGAMPDKKIGYLLSKKGKEINQLSNKAWKEGVVAKKFGRNYIGIELNPDYVKTAERRLAQTGHQLEMT